MKDIELHRQHLWEQFGIGLQGLRQRQWVRDMAKEPNTIDEYRECLQKALQAEINAMDKVIELENLLNEACQCINRDGALRIDNPLVRRMLDASKQARA